jgi:hypothetical protein
MLATCLPSATSPRPPDPIKGTPTPVATSTTHSCCPHFFYATPSATPPSSSHRRHPSPSSAQLYHPAAQCRPGWGPLRPPLPPCEVAARIWALQRWWARTPMSSGRSSVHGPWWIESATGPRARGQGPWLFPFRNNSKSFNPHGFVQKPLSFTIFMISSLV